MCWEFDLAWRVTGKAPGFQPRKAICSIMLHRQHLEGLAVCFLRVRAKHRRSLSSDLRKKKTKKPKNNMEYIVRPFSLFPILYPKTYIPDFNAFGLEHGLSSFLRKACIHLKGLYSVETFFICPVF